jgi:hypothetical protein
MQPTPVGEAGGSKGQGVTGRRGITRLAWSEAEEVRGDRPRDAEGFTLARREGLAPEHSDG